MSNRFECLVSDCGRRHWHANGPWHRAEDNDHGQQHRSDGAFVHKSSSHLSSTGQRKEDGEQKRTFHPKPQINHNGKADNFLAALEARQSPSSGRSRKTARSTNSFAVLDDSFLDETTVGSESPTSGKYWALPDNLFDGNWHANGPWSSDRNNGHLLNKMDLLAAKYGENRYTRAQLLSVRGLCGGEETKNSDDDWPKYDSMMRHKYPGWKRKRAIKEESRNNCWQ